MKKIKILTLICFVGALSGCVATSIREMNQALNQAYLTKMQIINDVTDPAQVNQLSLQSSVLTLKAIADESTALAMQAKEIKNKIVFHRIAATAAWQSEQQNVTKYALTGQQLCQALQSEEDKIEMAAHCALLALLPVYAMVDGFQAEYNALAKLRSQSQQLTVEQLASLNQRATVLLNGYSQALDAALLQRDGFNKANLSQSFLSQADQKLAFIACDALPQANQLRVNQRANVDAAQCAIHQRQRQLSQMFPLPQACQVDLDVAQQNCP